MKTLLASVSCFICFGVFAQGSPERAFRNSYSNESKKDYQAAINDIAPFASANSYECNLRLGWLYFLNKNYSASEGYYAKAVALKPGGLEARFGYVKPLSLLEKWDKVLDQYNAILKSDPQNTQANYWTGVILYNRKQYDPASRYFSRVVALYPFDYDANHMMGWASLFAGRKSEAHEYFAKALLIKPDDSSASDGFSRSK